MRAPADAASATDGHDGSRGEARHDRIIAPSARRAQGYSSSSRIRRAGASPSLEELAGCRVDGDVDQRRARRSRSSRRARPRARPGGRRASPHPVAAQRARRSRCPESRSRASAADPSRSANERIAPYPSLFTMTNVTGSRVPDRRPHRDASVVGRTVADQREDAAAGARERRADGGGQAEAEAAARRGEEPARPLRKEVVQHRVGRRRFLDDDRVVRHVLRERRAALFDRDATAVIPARCAPSATSDAAARARQRSAAHGASARARRGSGPRDGRGGEPRIVA